MTLGNDGKNISLSTFKIVIFILSLVSFVTAGWFALQSSYDFHLRWNETRYLFTGNDIYDPAFFQKYDVQPNYPPSCLFFLIPFTWFDFGTAKIIWLALNLSLTFLLARDLCGLYFKGKNYFLLLALILLSTAWRTEVHVGHLVLLSLYAFVLAVKLQEQNKVFLSGLAIALSLVKFPLTIPMLAYFLIYKRVWKNVAVALGLHLFAHLLISLYLRQSPLQLLTGALAYSRVNDITNGGYLDLHAFWHRLTGEAGIIPDLAGILSALGAFFVLFKKRVKDDLGTLTFISMTSTILVYHRSYDYLVVIFGLIWLLKRNRPDKWSMFFAPGVMMTAYLSFHYFRVLPGSESLEVFLKGDPFLTILSLFWYLSIGTMAFYLYFGEKESLLEPQT